MAERNVTSKFLIRELFTLASRGMLMVIGDITEGGVRIGARVTSGAEIDVPVAAIEMLNRRSPEKTGVVALGFRYSDEAELSRWLGQDLPGKVLTLEEDRSRGSGSQ